MRIILFAGFALGCLLGIGAVPASAGSINGMQQVDVCDPTTNQGLNCVKPNSDGSINVSGTISAGGVAQGSTTSGQTGQLVQCAVTTAAPTYTTAQTDPLNCTTAGGLRVLDANSAALLTAAQAAIPAGTNAIGTVQMGTTPACGSVISISQTASTDLHTASGKTYICSIVLVAPDAEVVSLVEGTGSTCATGVAALLGSTTAANGMSFAANGGFTSTSAAPWLAMQTTSDHLCLLQSGSGRIAGVITYNDH